MSTTASDQPAAPALTVLRRKDYRPVDYTTKTVSLDFSIAPNVTRVTAEIGLDRLYSPEAGEIAPRPLPLFRGDAEIQSLVSIELNGKALSEGTDYTVDAKTVTILAPPTDASFSLKLVTDIKPEANTSLEGLYRSGSAYCTQCEAEGFRNIVPFQDRPDVMATYTVRVEADKASCPVLLSNGNLVDSGDAPGGRHFTVWRDPFPKPSYLFALVAGDLALHEDAFVTCSGKKVALRIFVEHRDAGRTSWAMESLKRSFKWDEDKFGREYDLELFNIVAVSDFNMGAMENKSLNVFNSRLVLASTATATDVDLNRIEGVIGHEYFHNWTGNRVTCRDWFQLTLKEGLTVYRDQQFTADMNSAPVKRIEDVVRLRASQFGEDAGPTSHPIRPDEVGKMDNFYTATVYEKGAEVIRMYATILGVSGFRRGMDTYFARHDGQAVTCDDFWQAMYDANKEAGVEGVEDLQALKGWYSQAGTPELSVSPVYDAATRTLTLTATQRTPPTPGQAAKQPVLIPIAVGLVGADGKDVPLALQGAALPAGTTTTVLRLTQPSQSWTFTDVPEGAVPSILRGFSAPVRLAVAGQTDAQLLHLFAHDSDAFNRFEAGQVLGRKALVALYDASLAAVSAAGGGAGVDVAAVVQTTLGGSSGAAAPFVTGLAAAFSSLLGDTSLDGAFLARALSLPSETEVIDTLAADASGGHGWADPVVVHHVRDFVVKAIATALKHQLQAAVERTDAAIAEAEKASGGYAPDFASVARRSLRNKALGYLSTLGETAIVEDLAARHAAANNMTDSMATLVALADQPAGSCPQRTEALEGFYKRWAGEPLVLLKWLAVAASYGTTEEVRALMTHDAFATRCGGIRNPNCCYSTFMSYAGTPAFHAADGSGYAFYAEVVRTLDAVNPTVASRVVSAFTKYRSYDPARQALIRAQLQGLAAGKLSENTGEIVSRSLSV